jgi:hypothetical protein
MSDNELLNVIAAGGRGYRKIVEEAIMHRLLDSIEGGGEDAARLQAWIEQADFAVKHTVYVAKTCSGDREAAAEAAAEALVGLALNLRELRTDALVAIGKAAP